MISTPFVSVPPVRYGGTELIVAALLQGLVARDHEITLYATGDSRVSGVDVRWLYRQAAWPPDPYVELNHTAFAVRDILAAGRFDLVHAHTPASLAFAGLLDMPLVYTIHNCREETLFQLARDNVTSTLLMVAISDRQRLLHGELGANTHVIHHGLDVAHYPIGAGAGGYVAFLGRMAREKGPHTAIDAARQALTPIRLAGRPHPKDLPYFEAEVRPRLQQPDVGWSGEADHASKVALFGGALATLFPIDWEEPFGLVMLESMLCGTPVLAFARGAAPEVVEPGVTGWLARDVPDLARLIQALARGELPFDRARCRTHAATHFGLDVMVGRYEAVYREALGRAPSATVLM